MYIDYFRCKSAPLGDPTDENSTLSTSIIRHMNLSHDFATHDIIHSVQRNRPGPMLAIYHLLLRREKIERNKGLRSTKLSSSRNSVQLINEQPLAQKKSDSNSCHEKTADVLLPSPQAAAAPPGQQLIDTRPRKHDGIVRERKSHDEILSDKKVITTPTQQRRVGPVTDQGGIPLAPPSGDSSSIDGSTQMRSPKTVHGSRQMSPIKRAQLKRVSSLNNCSLEGAKDILHRRNVTKKHVSLDLVKANLVIDRTVEVKEFTLPHLTNFKPAMKKPNNAVYASPKALKKPIAPSPPRAYHNLKDSPKRSVIKDTMPNDTNLKGSFSSQSRNRRPVSKRYSISLFSRKQAGSDDSKRNATVAKPETAGKKSRDSVFTLNSTHSEKEECQKPPYISLPTLVHTTVPMSRIKNSQKTGVMAAERTSEVSSAPRINASNGTPITSRKKKHSRQNSVESTSTGVGPAFTQRHSRKSISEPIAAALSYLKSNKKKTGRR